MPLDITTAVTGVVIGGFTTPGYTLTLDTAPLSNQRQSIVSALTGTQTGVRTHTPSDPFYVNASKPIRNQAVPRQNPITGSIPLAGRNKYELVVKKGTIPLTGQSPQVSEVRVTSLIVAGSETADPANLAAMYSFTAALLNREAANLLAMAKTGSI